MLHSNSARTISNIPQINCHHKMHHTLRQLSFPNPNNCSTMNTTHLVILVQEPDHEFHCQFQKAGEIFVTMAKQGSLISGLMDSWATTISISLQYGVPLYVLVKKMLNSHYEPYGFTTNPQIRIAKSLADYMGRYLAIHFLNPSELDELGIKSDKNIAVKQTALDLDDSTADDAKKVTGPVDGIQAQEFGDVKNDGQDHESQENVHRAGTFEEAEQVIDQDPDEEDFQDRTPHRDQHIHALLPAE